MTFALAADLQSETVVRMTTKKENEMTRLIGYPSPVATSINYAVDV
jgi:hypothetical protein